ncbi:MAG TPA: YMGG-like glycine zipper-containing protein [Opitutaceae bacterium]
MNTKSILTVIVAAALCAGCEGTGPNTQNGAVTGGALGALAGAIIGNNSGGHNALGGAAIGAVVGAIAGGTVGNSVDHQNGTIYRSEGDATTNVAVESMPPQPPAPAELQTAQPTPSAMWVYGYYDFDGYRYLWVPGHWEIPPPNAVAFVRPHWRYRGGSYVYIRGYWR